MGWPSGALRTGVLRTGVRVRPVVGAVLLGLASAAVPGGEAVAVSGPGGYGFAPGARPVAGGGALAPGTTYRGSLPRDRAVHYRLDLDAASAAYVSVTAVPASGAEVTAVDGVRVSVRDADGGTCSSDSAIFGAARSLRPLTALGTREAAVPGGTRCRAAGAYDVTVERTRPEDSPPGDWALELLAVTEPRPASPGPTEAPDAWDSASPAPLDGAPQPRHGGTGFADATPLDEGVWRDAVRPGETLFYRVPLDWGRQLHATAELDGAGGATGYTSGALRLALHNPVRAEVDDVGRGWTGRPVSVGLAPLPPVAYANRYARGGHVGALRFAGSYYLVVHLAGRAAEDFGPGPYGLTLRVRLGGTARSGPAYAGEPVPAGVFTVPGGGGAVAGGGDAGGGRVPMAAVAAGGLGTGTLLLVGLGAWTLAARRGAGRVRRG
ncbi:hypothetical protein [Streptomyces sp. NPDC003717]|uniref:hypothetical protein n=1 Tax=Streptomyces sp. NPDC003717 TaxID=3154276 RepID=UPI00339DC91C